MWVPARLAVDAAFEMAERVSTVVHVPVCSRYFPHVTHKILYKNALSFFTVLTGSRVFQYVP